MARITMGISDIEITLEEGSKALILLRFVNHKQSGLYLGKSEIKELIAALELSERFLDGLL